MEGVKCSECRFYMNEAWTYSYCGLQVGVTKACLCPQNGEVGCELEDGILRFPIDGRRIAENINKNHDCSWYEPGRNKYNTDGKLPQKELLEIERSQEEFASRASRVLGGHFAVMDMARGGKQGSDGGWLPAKRKKGFLERLFGW
jgi:hypothetical protein